MKNKVKSPFYRIQKEIQHKRTLLKIKAVLFIVLPVLIILISIKVLRTYLHIRFKEIFLHQKPCKEILQTSQTSQTDVQNTFSNKKHPE